MGKWQQLELFDYVEVKKNIPKGLATKKNKKYRIDYKALFLYLQTRTPFTAKDIQEITGLSTSTVSKVIDGLSLKFPIYELKFGVYDILE